MLKFTRFASVFAAFAAALCFGMPAGAASLQTDSATLAVPDGWQSAKGNYASSVPASVNAVFDCVSRNPNEVKIVGWKLEGDVVEGAYCVTHQKSGMGRVREILKTTQGADREKAASAVMDAFTAEVQAGMTSKGLSVSDMSANIIEAGKDLLVVIDGKGSGSAGSFVRSSTMILHGDGLLTVGSLHKDSASGALVKQLDDIAASVKWKK